MEHLIRTCARIHQLQDIEASALGFQDEIGELLADVVATIATALGAPSPTDRRVIVRDRRLLDSMPARIAELRERAAAAAAIPDKTERLRACHAVAVALLELATDVGSAYDDVFIEKADLLAPIEAHARLLPDSRDLPAAPAPAEN